LKYGIKYRRMYDSKASGSAIRTRDDTIERRQVGSKIRSFSGTRKSFATRNATSYVIAHLYIGGPSSRSGGVTRRSNLIAVSSMTYSQGEIRGFSQVKHRHTPEYVDTRRISISEYSPGSLYSGAGGRESASYSSSRIPRIASTLSTGKMMGPRCLCGIYRASAHPSMESYTYGELP